MPSSSKFICFYFVLILLSTIFSPSTAICKTNSDAGTRSETGVSSISGRLIIKDGIIYIWFTKSHAEIAAGRLLVVPKDELPPELTPELADRHPIMKASKEAYEAWKKCQELKGKPEEQRACEYAKYLAYKETVISFTEVMNNNPGKPEFVKRTLDDAKNQLEKSLEAYQESGEGLKVVLSDPDINTDKVIDALPISPFNPDQ